MLRNIYIIIAIFICSCAKQTPEEIEAERVSSAIGNSIGLYIFLSFWCSAVYGIAKAVKYTKLVELAAIGHVIFLITSSAMLISLFTGTYINKLQPISGMVIFINILLFILHTTIFSYSLAMLLRAPISEWNKLRLLHQEEAKQTALQQEAADRDNLAKQVLLDQHVAEQAANLKMHKHRMAAKHVAELAHYANELDGSLDDSATIGLMLRVSSAFLEDAELLTELKADNSLQAELREILHQLILIGQEHKVLYQRLSRWLT